MFAKILEKYNWDDIRDLIYSKTTIDVENALNTTDKSIDDFAALISPAAQPYIENMAVKSRYLTQKRFGKTIQLYVPLYLSNFCENNCVYCGFSAKNKIRRKVLNHKEIEEEIIAIKRLGFQHILLVTGEAEIKAGVTYLKEAFEIIKKHISHISIEVQPMSEQDYTSLVKSGLNTVYLYQETYNIKKYSQYHLTGKKSNFTNRLNTFESLGRAGVHKIGLGILAGLEDWRIDSFFTAMHLNYLQKKYWKTKYSVSFPRLRPNVGGFEPNYIMTDKDLAQLIFAYRLFDENIELALSTRENSTFRNNMMSLGVTSMSAESKTTPGGYAYPENDKELEQFEISDDRTAKQVQQMINKNGYEAVWKDWDLVLQK